MLANQEWNGEHWTQHKPLGLEFDQTFSNLFAFASSEGYLNVLYQTWRYNPELRAVQNLLLFSQRKIDIREIQGLGPLQPGLEQPDNSSPGEPDHQTASQPVEPAEPMDLTQIHTDFVPQGSRWQGVILGVSLAMIATVLTLGLRFLYMRRGR
jgi:hypothetical protein